MSDTLHVPPHVLSVAMLAYSRSNPYRYRRETGGWLLARAEDPHTIVAATGPGKDFESDEGSCWFGLVQFTRPVEREGFRVVGDYHLHPDGKNVEASPEDQAAWRADLARSPGLDSWRTLILARGADGRFDNGAASAWSTDRSGLCLRTSLSPSLSRATVADAQSCAWQVEKHSPLLNWPSTWEPGALRREVAMLELNAEMIERVRRQETDERLRRLGITVPDRKPATRSPAAAGRATSDVKAAAGGVRSVAPPVRRQARDLGVELMAWLNQAPPGIDGDTFEQLLLLVQRAARGGPSLAELHAEHFAGVR